MLEALQPDVYEPDMFALPRPRYEELPGYREALAKSDQDTQISALEVFLQRFQLIYERLLRDPQPDYEARIGAGDDKLMGLQTDGFALFKADEALKAQLRDLVEPLTAELLARIETIARPKFRDSQLMLDRAVHPEVFATVEAILAAANLPAVASAYAGRPVIASAMAVQVNTEHSTRALYGNIDEAGVPEIPTAYFHIDSAVWPHQKVLMYLDPVGLEEGPFRYVRGSHRMTKPFELAVRKANDRLGLSREQFMALPELFRVFAEFGGQMDPYGPEAEALLAREVAVYDEAGSDLILFDYHGVHRGGFVRSGVRRMLQCTFRIAPQP